RRAARAADALRARAPRSAAGGAMRVAMDRGPLARNGGQAVRLSKLILRIAVVVLTLGALAFALLWDRGWLPGRFAPRKLVLRGCLLTPAPDVLALLDCDGTQ